ncbi:DNA-directed RNA polymerase III subunit RPC3 [Cinnamomum micranthum f. kanehirae]|uniref:DNA-directed RNA polymerase III subunit RPC3 n=1 Tax=Cinnamomum micranthum f. kanehirae TaxID=337451 RepID=A0A443PZL6_9MAGN|nr:DNA-directed RNA polymerase III subunit RPC3 [Cinnamomum micranthum f. kanehirae]
MLTQQGLEYAVHIIKSHFGDLVSKVCKCLLQRGPLTLQALAQRTQLPRDQLKKCLLVLIQHNCVQAFIAAEAEETSDLQRNFVQYIAIFDNILHRSRFSKFLQIAEEQLDGQCEELLKGLLQHGRLTLESVIARAVSQKNEGNSESQDAHRANFVRLVHAHFVERCPTAQPVLEPFAGELLTIEKRAITAAAPSHSERFSVIVDIGSDIDVKNNQRCSSATTGEKACVANVRSKLDVKTGTVLEAILEATRSSEEKVKEEMSVPLSMDTILQEVRGRPEGLEMTLEHVRAALNQLGCVPSLAGTEGLYSIDLKNIIANAQNEEVEAVVLNRYGREAYRIFRLLAKDSRLLETNQISDTTLVDKKEASELLFRLWKDGFLDMERMSSTLPKQATIFLWKVKKDSLWEHVVDTMYHAALNVSQRMDYEREQEQELRQIQPDLMTEALKKRYNRLRRVMLILESSLLKLDDAFMLFNDF